MPRCKISIELGLEASNLWYCFSVRGDRDIHLAPKMIIQYNKWESIKKQWMNEALSSDENSFAYLDDTRELSMNQLLKITRWFTWYHLQQWAFVCFILSFKTKLPKRSGQFSLVSDGVNYNRLSQLAIQFRKSSGLSSTCLFQSRLVNSWN